MDQSGFMKMNNIRSIVGAYFMDIYADKNGHIEYLSQFKNIIIKYGRFIPNHKPHNDEVLGINLASDNQYAERIS